jgi:hypothetical protein
MFGGSLYSQDVKVRFRVQITQPIEGRTVGIRGSLAPLSWERSSQLISVGSDGIYEVEVPFSLSLESLLEYKFVIEGNPIQWELENENRLLILTEGLTDVEAKWNVSQPFDVSTLPPYSANQLMEDFNILESALEKLHPGLYRYHTKEEMDSIFDFYKGLLNRDMSRGEAFALFSQLTASIQCGHTYPNFYNQNGLIKQVVLNGPDKLPFSHQIIDHKMYVAQTATKDEILVRGTEIIAINGVKTADILSTLLGYVKADGANESKRIADLNTFGVNGIYEAFDMYFPLVFPSKTDQYELTIVSPSNGDTTFIAVEPMTRAERNGILSSRDSSLPKSPNDLWRLEFWENNTAYLQLATFDVFPFTFDWKEFLDKSFSEIKKKKAQRLVIDIRWNEGGQDEVILVLGRYLMTSDPLKVAFRDDLMRFQRLPDELRPYVFTWDTSYYDVSARTSPWKDDFYKLQSEGPYSIKPHRNAFNGEKVVLINSANSSATFYLAELIKMNNIATLVGETTGGSTNGINGGMIFFLRLPSTQIEVDIPVIGSFKPSYAASSNDEGGIKPDIEIKQSFIDFLQGKDSVIEYLKK